MVKGITIDIKNETICMSVAPNNVVLGIARDLPLLYDDASDLD